MKNSRTGQPIYLIDKTCHFIPKPGTKHFVAVSCKRLQKFHTGTSSYRFEFVPVSCKYPLREIDDDDNEDDKKSAFEDNKDISQTVLHSLIKLHLTQTVAGY